MAMDTDRQLMTELSSGLSRILAGGADERSHRRALARVLLRQRRFLDVAFWIAAVTGPRLEEADVSLAQELVEAVEAASRETAELERLVAEPTQ